MKIYNLIFMLLFQAFIFLACSQNTEYGFKRVADSHDKILFEDVNMDIHKGSPKDSLENLLSLYGIKFEARNDLTSLEKSIFSLEERNQIQGYGYLSALAFFTIEAG